LHRADEEIPGREDRQPAEAEKDRPRRRPERVERQAHGGEGDDGQRAGPEQTPAHHSSLSSSSSSWSSYFLSSVSRSRTVAPLRPGLASAALPRRTQVRTSMRMTTTARPNVAYGTSQASRLNAVSGGMARTCWPP